MKFRDRLTLAFVAIAVLPLAILGLGVRRGMTRRLDEDAAKRVAAVAAASQAGIKDEVAADRAGLGSLAGELTADNRFRIAVASENSPERQWLLDWAPSAMRLAGFRILVLQDSSGRVLSSGQFRNDFDRMDPALSRAVGASPMGAAVVDARTPEGSVRALVSIESLTVRGERFTLVGGHVFDSTVVARLSTDAAVAVSLAIGGGARDGEVPGISLPYVDDASGGAQLARIALWPDSGPTQALKAGVTRWLLITLGSALLAALVLATLMGRRSAAPIAELADKTARLDLDRLDQKFGTERTDEIGALERTLDALTQRLRTSASLLREAERAAATGDLARQVNHDIKNGLAPIRNVLRHLSQTAEREPEQLSAIYSERRGTLESGVEYLEELARNYARLSPALTRSQTDPRPVVLEVARGVTTAQVQLRVAEPLPKIRADAVVLHRILDNLVSNAVDALEGKPGTITIGAEAAGEGIERRVRFSVADTGRGMTRQELERAFNDFHTTKPTGTGLGLSVVRRLVGDVGGSVKADTAPGQGTTFTVEIPAA